MRRYVFRLALLSLAALSPSVSYGDDQQIAQQILEKLQAEKKAGTLKGFSIDLQVDEGTVWLSGRVTSEQQQARALDLARRVSGVKQVVNDLTVGSPTKAGVAAKAVATPKVETLAPAYSYNPAPAQSAAVAPAIPFTPIESPRSIPATPIEPAAEHNAVAVEMPPAPAAPAMIEATPLAAEPKAQPQAEEYVPASTPAPLPQAAQRQSQSERRPASQSVLNNVSKSLMGAVHGSKSEAVQHASTSQEIAKATGSGPIGSGVEPGTFGTHRGVVQAAQPVANVATAESMQPVYPAGPQMAGMVPMGMPYPYMVPVYAGPRPQVPLAVAPASSQSYVQGGGAMGAPQPMYMPGSGVGVAPARYDHPQMPGYAWPSYAASPNYAAVTYPKQYSPTAWPYIGPFYPYPQVPLGWRKVTMEWDDGWWFLDFKDRRTMYNH